MRSQEMVESSDIPPGAAVRRLVAAVGVVVHAAARDECAAGLGREEAGNLGDGSSPELTSALDDLPAGLRDGIGRELLAHHRLALESRLNVLEQRVRAVQSGQGVAPRSARHADLLRERKIVARELVAIRMIEGDPLSVDNPGGIRVLLFDGRNGRIAVSRGDLVAADNIAVFVPGMGANLSSFDYYLALANDLRTGAMMAAPDSATAVVVWLDYRAPHDRFSALSPSRARAAAPPLASFMEAIETVNRPARRTLVGHSYGATVVGQTALRHPLRIHALVGIAAPGMRARAAGEFRLPAAAVVHAVTDRTGSRRKRDPIAKVADGWWTRRLGPDPALPAFGAHRFDVGDADGHEAALYLDPTSVAGRNMAEIVVGCPPDWSR
jgi:pimeloyl-ACP methyl ester carboxylesterase